MPHTVLGLERLCLCAQGGESGPGVKLSQNGQVGGADACPPAAIKQQDGANSVAATVQTHEESRVQTSTAERVEVSSQVEAPGTSQPAAQPATPSGRSRGSTPAFFPSRSSGEGSVLQQLATVGSLGSAKPPLANPETTELADDDVFKGPPPLDASAVSIPLISCLQTPRVSGITTECGETLQEKTRVYALKRLGVSYTSRETSLDFITRLVTSVCNVQAAVMTFIDNRRGYVKSAAGGFENVESFDRRLSISTWNLIPLNPEVLVVEDLSVDDRWASGLLMTWTPFPSKGRCRQREFFACRFKDHPYVRGPPSLRFFASVPLLDASGQRVGALCILSPPPL